MAIVDVSVTQSHSNKEKDLTTSIPWERSIVCLPATHRKARFAMGSESSSFRPKRHPSDSPDAPNKKRPPVGDEAPLADAEDAITQDEIHGAELQSDKPSKSGKIRNACMLALPDLSGTS